MIKWRIFLSFWRKSDAAITVSATGTVEKQNFYPEKHKPVDFSPIMEYDIENG